MSDERPANPADDDAYSRLFRPEPDQPPAVAAPVPLQPVVSDIPAPAPAPAEATSPAPREPSADTGRLFRSSRAATETAALPAVASDQATKLRTLAVAEAPPPATSVPDPIRVNSAESRPAASLLGATAAPSETGEPLAMPRSRSDAGLKPVGVYAITIGAVILAGLPDIVIGGSGLGLFTGIVFLIATVFCALRVRLGDAAVAVIAPPIAFFVGCITVGQIGRSSTGGFLGRIVNTFFMLAGNWLWVIGATLIALAIVLVRGRRAA